jgi:hypothetical protein
VCAAGLDDGLDDALGEEEVEEAGRAVKSIAEARAAAGVAAEVTAAAAAAGNLRKRKATRRSMKVPVTHTAREQSSPWSLAASSLATLAQGNNKNQSEITTLLVSLLEGAAVTQGRAASLLWRIVRENTEAESVIAHAGSVDVLVRLLECEANGVRAHRSHCAQTHPLICNEQRHATDDRRTARACAAAPVLRVC